MAEGKDSIQRPDFGRRLLPCILDDEAKTNPHRIFATVAKSQDPSQGFKDVPFQQVANAVNDVAYTLEAVFEPQADHDFETLTYIGVPDLRYNIVCYAAIKCGYKVNVLLRALSAHLLTTSQTLLPSPRNPRATNVLLMEQTHSSKIIYAEAMDAVVKDILSLRVDWKGAAIKPLDELLNAEGPLYHYNPSFDEAVRHPIVVLHSSGSTGTPKPVVMTHGTFAVMDNDRNYPTVPGRRNQDLTLWDFDGSPSRIYEPFPPFHLAGFLNKIMLPLYTHTIPVFGPPLQPPNGGLVASIMQQQKIRGCLLPPSVAEALLNEPDGLNYFKQLDVFVYAGAPLPQAVGDKLSKVTTVCQFYGSTEVGQIRQLVPRPEDWSYMEFHPNTKLEFRPSDDDSFELVILADATTEDSMSLNHNYPGLREWQTKDLFRTHPEKRNLWRFHGRKDDIIVLLNGEKLNPVPMESLLQGLSIVSGALVVGQKRNQPALLLEMKVSGGQTENDLLDEIWPAVESANAKMPGHGRVMRSLMLLAKPKKPLVRAGKGTVVRKATESAFATEIEQLYANRQQPPLTKPSPLIATRFSPDAITHLIRSVISSGIDVDQLEDSDDLYASGLDSLKTIEAVEALKSSLLPHRAAQSLSWLSSKTFYNHPSVGQLSRLLQEFLNDGVIPQEKRRSAEMNDVFENLARSLASSKASPVVKNNTRGLSIILTGTTGTLGTHLLEEFSQDQMVSMVYCLNRSPTAERQWRDNCKKRNIRPPPDSADITFITVDYRLDNLGIRSSQLSDLMNECDMIVHNAWKVDFNQDLSSFTENMQSVITFANWSISNPYRPRIVFLSSISSVGPWNFNYDDEIGIPETPIHDFSAALSIGYGESKAISERLLGRAASESQVPISILRIGQIGGPMAETDARWTQRDSIPSMLKTSKTIGLIPANLPTVDWIPVDTVSKIVNELAIKDVRDLSSSPKYFHILNPCPVPWSEFIPLLKQYCGPGTEAVSLSHWVKSLREYDATDPNQLSTKPALKLLNFFSLVASHGPTTKVQTSASIHGSKTMANLAPVSHTLMENWLKQSM